MNKDSTLQMLDTWPVNERIDFLLEAWSRLVDSGWQPELTDEQRIEFDRRLDALDSNPDDVVGWESVQECVKRAR